VATSPLARLRLVPLVAAVVLGLAAIALAISAVVIALLEADAPSSTDSACLIGATACAAAAVLCVRWVRKPAPAVALVDKPGTSARP